MDIPVSNEPKKALYPNLKPIQKGEVRNPVGRVLGSKNRATIAKEFAAIVTGGVNVKGDIDPSMTAEELMNAALWRKAFLGDINAIKELQDTLHGKIAEESNVNMQATVSRVERTIVDVKGE